MTRMTRWIPLVALSLLLSSCALAPRKYPRHSLVDQILRFRPGHQGLTNRACLRYDEHLTCQEYEIVEYSLEDPAFRKAATDLGFICNVGGRRYKVCKDDPGLCRITKKGFIFKRKKVDFIGLDRLDFLLQANTRCFARDSYPFDAAS